MSSAKLGNQDRWIRLERIGTEYIRVEFKSPGVAIEKKSFLYTDHKLLVDYFAKLADDWQGWHGSREWASVESDVKITATNDGKSSVTLRMNLLHDNGDGDTWNFSGSVSIGHGELAATAASITEVFGDSAEVD